MEKKSFSKIFTNLELSQELDKEVEAYLVALQEEYSYVYVAFLLTSPKQGALKGIKKEDFERHHVDMHDFLVVSINNEWSIYAALVEVQWVKNLFMNADLDLIYSPFALLNSLIIKQKPINRATCYLLNYQYFFILALFNGEQFVMGDLYSLPQDEIDEESLRMMDSWETQVQKDDEQDTSNKKRDVKKMELSQKDVPKERDLGLCGKDRLIYQHL